MNAVPPPLPTQIDSFDTMSVLHVFDEKGQLIGWFYHPNREALLEKARDTEKMMPTFKAVVREYGKMREIAIRNPDKAWLGGLVGGVLARFITDPKHKTVLWTIAHEVERGLDPMAVTERFANLLREQGTPLESTVIDQVALSLGIAMGFFWGSSPENDAQSPKVSG